MTDQQTNTFIFGALCLIAGWMFAVWFRGSGEKSEQIKQMDKRIDALELQAAEVVVKVTPMWAKVQKQISEDLHKPHEKYKEMDGLLEQLEALTIDEKGTKRLKELLVERSTDMSDEVTEDERASATIMSIVMDKALEESKHTGILKNVELVGEFKPTVEDEG